MRVEGDLAVAVGAVQETVHCPREVIRFQRHRQSLPVLEGRGHARGLVTTQAYGAVFKNGGLRRTGVFRDGKQQCHQRDQGKKTDVQQAEYRAEKDQAQAFRSFYRTVIDHVMFLLCMIRTTVLHLLSVHLLS
jgi:hypothetical protein